MPARCHCGCGLEEGECRRRVAGNVPKSLQLDEPTGSLLDIGGLIDPAHAMRASDLVDRSDKVARLNTFAWRDVARNCTRAALLLGVGVVTALSLAPAAALPPMDLWDKLEHAIAYACLAAAGCVGFPSRRGRLRVILALAVLGGLLELAQTLAPGREPSLGDWIANVTGIGVGCLAALLIDPLVRTRRRTPADLPASEGAATSSASTRPPLV